MNIVLFLKKVLNTFLTPRYKFWYFDYDRKFVKSKKNQILFNLLSTRIGIPEFIINRYRRSRRAAMRNAKIRLSNLKVGELTQVMRGKSKHIKH